MTHEIIVRFVFEGDDERFNIDDVRVALDELPVVADDEGYGELYPQWPPVSIEELRAAVDDLNAVHNHDDGSQLGTDGGCFAVEGILGVTERLLGGPA